MTEHDLARLIGDARDVLQSERLLELNVHPRSPIPAIIEGLLKVVDEMMAEREATEAEPRRLTALGAAFEAMVQHPRLKRLEAGTAVMEVRFVGGGHYRGLSRRNLVDGEGLRAATRKMEQSDEV